MTTGLERGRREEKFETARRLREMGMKDNDIHRASLQALGLDTRERAGILVLVNRLINLEDKELRAQYFDELKKLKGENNMAELTWIEEHFRDEGIAIGEERGRSETLNAAIDFMRSNGMSNEQINSFRNSVLNS